MKIARCPMCNAAPVASSPGEKWPGVRCSCGRKDVAGSLAEAVECWNNAADKNDPVKVCPACGKVPIMRAETTFDGCDIGYACCGITGEMEAEKIAYKARQAWNAAVDAYRPAAPTGCFLCDVGKGETHAPDCPYFDEPAKATHEQLDAFADTAHFKVLLTAARAELADEQRLRAELIDGFCRDAKRIAAEHHEELTKLTAERDKLSEKLDNTHHMLGLYRTRIGTPENATAIVERRDELLKAEKVLREERRIAVVALRNLREHVRTLAKVADV